MLRLLLSVILMLCTSYTSLATYVPLLKEYEREGIRNRHSPIAQSILEQKRAENNYLHKDNKENCPSHKNWKQIEDNMMLSLVRFRNAHNASLRLDAVINNLKGSAAIGNAFKDFVKSYGIFEEDQIECMRRRCLLAMGKRE